MGELKSLNKYLFKYRYRLLAGVAFICLSNWFTIYPAQLFRDAIDLVIENLKIQRQFAGSALEEQIFDHFITGFIIVAAILVLIAVIKGIFTFFMRYTIIMVSRFIEFDLKNEIYAHYQKLDVSFYKSNNVGDIMNRIGDDVSKVRMYLGPSIMYIINLIVLFVLILWTMFSINASLSWYVLTPLPIMSVIIYFVSKRIGAKSELVQKQLSRVFSLTQETFSGIRVIKSYNKSDDTIGEFDKEAQRYMDDSMSLIKTESLFHPVILFLPVLSTLLTIYMGGIAVVNNEMSYGNIAEFVIYINLLTWPVASLGWVSSLIQRAKASMKRINEFLKTEPKVSNSSQLPIDFNGDWEFKDVGFSYPESGTVALKDISFELKHGQTLAIVGKTGSGKSTIAHLMSRLYDNNEGSIQFNNTVLKDINLDELRSNTGIVPQDSFLFSETVANNIRFGGSAGTSQEELEQAAKLACVHENIVRFKDGYDTMVGERGVTLSGGQKQRISLARALVNTPELLILDDCLSAVDAETEEKILSNLKTVMKDKTAVIISHRIEAIKHADLILVLDEGKIIERGQHADLVQAKGLYAELYSKQQMAKTEQQK